MNSSSNTLDKLNQIWCATLGVATVAPRDDFFVLGGNSMRAASMIFKTEQAFNVEIPLSMVAGDLTLGKMLALVETLINTAEPTMESGEI
jgi:acyl carrier protein